MSPAVDLLEQLVEYITGTIAKELGQCPFCGDQIKYHTDGDDYIDKDCLVWQSMMFLKDENPATKQ